MSKQCLSELDSNAADVEVNTFLIISLQLQLPKFHGRHCPMSGYLKIYQSKLNFRCICLVNLSRDFINNSLFYTDTFTKHWTLTPLCKIDLLC